jgi:hypothetical protein
MLSPEDVDPEIVANCLEAMENTAPTNFQAMELEDIARIILASASERVGRDMERMRGELVVLRKAEMQADEQRAAAELALALLHEGEQPPPEDEGIELSPAQMIWRWNRATPADRLAAATYIREESYKSERYEGALRRIAERCPEHRRNSGYCSSEVARTALTGPEPTRG